jgi:hypothetical protein
MLNKELKIVLSEHIDPRTTIEKIEKEWSNILSIQYPIPGTIINDELKK